MENVKQCCKQLTGKKKKKKHLTSAVNILTKVFAKILGKILYP